MEAPTSAMPLPLPRAQDVLCTVPLKPPLKQKAPIVVSAANPTEMVPPTNLLIKGMPSFPLSSSNNKKKDLSKEKITPRDNDVLCGKTRQCLVHHGSVQFRYLIESYTERYEKAEDKYSKMSLTREIYNRVSQTSRFLRYSQKDGAWEELTPAVARDKVGHALRFSSLRRNKKPRRSRASPCPPKEVTITSSAPPSAPPSRSGARPTPVPQPQLSGSDSTLSKVQPPARKPISYTTSQQQESHTTNSGSQPIQPLAIEQTPVTVGSVLPQKQTQAKAQAQAQLPQQPHLPLHQAQVPPQTHHLQQAQPQQVQLVEPLIFPTAPQQALNSLFSNYIQSLSASSVVSTDINAPTQLLPPSFLLTTTESVPTADATPMPAPATAAITPFPPVPVRASNDGTTLDELFEFVSSSSDDITLNDLLSFITPSPTEAEAPEQDLSNLVVGNFRDCTTPSVVQATSSMTAPTNQTCAFPPTALPPTATTMVGEDDLGNILRGLSDSSFIPEAVAPTTAEETSWMDSLFD